VLRLCGFAGRAGGEDGFAEGAEVVAGEPLADAVRVEEVAAGQHLERHAGLELVEADAALVFVVAVRTWFEDHFRQICNTESCYCTRGTSWPETTCG
jgi:hypothetical protein